MVRRVGRAVVRVGVVVAEQVGPETPQQHHLMVETAHQPHLGKEITVVLEAHLEQMLLVAGVVLVVLVEIIKHLH